MNGKPDDPIKPWFDAMEDLGEYIGIRFGRLAPETRRPEWIFLRHTECDGVGGFADILRRRGAEVPSLPQIRHPSNPSWSWFFKTIPKYLAPRRRLKWKPLKQGPAVDARKDPPVAVAWFVFDEDRTAAMRRACRQRGFTVNSFLLKHLTEAIRPALEEKSAAVPWMIPVNLRGKVKRERETANHTSYVGVKVCAGEAVTAIHQNIYGALARGEHWANWYCYTAGRSLSHGLKKYLLATDKAMSEWFLGGFSNLGEWDSAKQIQQADCLGDWLFSPPTLRIQMVGAGCVTFQNRLSLLLQAHPDLTTHPEVVEEWMRDWVRGIRADLEAVPAGDAGPAVRAGG